MNREQYLAKRYWLSGIEPEAEFQVAAFGPLADDETSGTPTNSPAAVPSGHWGRLARVPQSRAARGQKLR
ncbi:MAG TPA: hypothetical protein VF816_17740 [Rhodocyclaceae bacterium]